MALEYRRLTTDRRKEAVARRLDTLEVQHYERRLDLMVSRDEGQSNRLMEEAQLLENDINELREEEAALDTEIANNDPANPPQQKSGKKN